MINTTISKTNTISKKMLVAEMKIDVRVLLTFIFTALKYAIPEYKYR